MEFFLPPQVNNLYFGDERPTDVILCFVEELNKFLLLHVFPFM